jgi:hypothetical protein
VKFEVEEHPLAPTAQLTDNLRPGGCEQLQAHLDPAQVRQAVHQGQSLFGIHAVKGNDEAVCLLKQSAAIGLCCQGTDGADVF